MKRILFYAAALLLLSSCEEFLQDEPLTLKTRDNFPVTVEDAKQMMAGIYTTMSNANQFPNKTFFYVAEVASDDRLGGGGINDNHAHAQDNLMTSDPNMLDHGWTQLYRGIYRANMAIESLDDITNFASDDQKNQFKGEAYFLRAFFYFQLTSLFEKVPLMLTTETVNQGAAEVDEIYGQIASDLKTAIEIMPVKKFNEIESGHATRWAAEALMGRVFLFYTGFYQKAEMPLAGGGAVSKQNVIDWLTDLRNNSGHRLVDDYRELWAYTNEKTVEDYEYTKGKGLKYAADNADLNPESIWMQKYNNFSDWDIRRGYSNQYMLYFGLRGLQSVANTFPFAGGWGQGPVAANMVADWENDNPNDVRLRASVLYIQDEIPKYSKGQWDFVQETDYWQKKYNGVAAKTADGNYVNSYSVLMYNNKDNNQLSHLADLVYIRYADVLLMLSELTQDATFMNEVRARAGLDPVAYSLENLQKERRWELAFEGIRWNDIRRWHIAENLLDKQANTKVYYYAQPDKNYVQSSVGYSGRYKATRGFFPIPQSQIDLSEGLLAQPAGWDTPDAKFGGWTNK